MCRAHSGVMWPGCCHSMHEYRVARSAMETQHIHCGERTGAATSAAFLLATAFLACQTRANGRTAKPGEGADPHPDFGGPKMSKKIRSRLWARRMRIAIWCARWGRSAGARCETRPRRASACVRRVGCTTYTGSPPQAATLPEGVRHVMGRADAHGGSLRVHGTAEGCTTHAVVAHAWCILPPVRRPGWTRGAFVWQLLCHKAHAG